MAAMLLICISIVYSYQTVLTSRATFRFAIALFTFSYITVLCIAIPQKIAKACQVRNASKKYNLFEKFKLQEV